METEPLALPRALLHLRDGDAVLRLLTLTCALYARRQGPVLP
jgi:hypothetical protein